MSGSGLETLPEVEKCLADRPGGPELVGRPPRGVEVFGTPAQRSGSSQDTGPEVHNWSGDPTECPEVDRRPSRTSGTDRGTLPKVRNWSGVPPEDLEMVETPARWSGSGQDTRPEVRNWSGDPTEGPEVDGRSFHSYESSRKALQLVRNR